MITEFILGRQLSSNAGTPQYVDVDAVKKQLLSVRGVADLHNLHVWSLNMNNCLISVHVAAGTETLECCLQNLIFFFFLNDFNTWNHFSCD